MREITLTATPRDESFIGSSPSRRLRREGRVPAVVYGLGDAAVPVTVDAREMQRALIYGANALINLQIGDDGQLTMTKDIQRHPVRGDLVHVDFVRIRADQEVQAEVLIHLTGEPEGAKEGGVLEHVLFTVGVSAKPRDLPESIEIDVSDLGVGEQKRVGDLETAPGVELLNDPDQVVANVVVPRLEEAAPPTLSAEEVTELEGLSEEELDALKELAAAKAPEEAAEEAEEAAEDAAAPEEGAGGDEGG